MILYNFKLFKLIFNEFSIVTFSCWFYVILILYLMFIVLNAQVDLFTQL